MRDNLAGLPMLPGPPGPRSSPSPPSSPIPPSSPSLTNITTPSSSSLTNVTPLPPPDSPKKTRTVRSRSKPLQSDSQKFLDQLKLEASQRPRHKSPPVIPIMPTHKSDSDDAIKKIKGQDESSKLLKKFSKKNKKKDTDIDDLIKELNEQNEKNKLLEGQKKLLEQQNKQNKILEQQNDELNKLLEQQKQEEEDIPGDTLNELDRNVNEMVENINSGPSIKFRTFAPRRNPVPSPSKIPAPITKSHEPQGLAAGEQAGIEIMKNDLKVSKDIIENLKKELNNTELLSQRYFEFKDKIIEQEYKALEIEKKIREREEDIERSYGRKI